MAARGTRKASGASRKKAGGKAKGNKKPGAKSGKKAVAKPNWGGRRAGAGRPVGTGKGASPDARHNRIAIMLSDDELRTLKSVARDGKLPVATAAYQMIKPKLRRKR
jgi:hypothetical protein